MFEELIKYGKVFQNISLKDKTSVRIGGIAHYFVEVNDIDCLSKLLTYLASLKMPYFIIGKGTNILFSDDYFDVVFISLKKINSCYLQDDLFIIESGSSNMQVVKEILNLGYFPPYCLSLVPGSIGGAIYMNASSNGQEIKDYLVKVDYLDNTGVMHTLENNSLFNYRFSPFQANQGIIVRGYFRFFTQDTETSKALLIEKRDIKKATQPLNTYNMGSVFKNVKNKKAWEIIKKCNLTNKYYGDAKISEKHANFLINEHNASFIDMITLIKDIQNTVFEKMGISLELEIKIITPNDINPYF